MQILIIQTTFIGDVILATPVLEKLHHFYPAAKIDLLVRKGNESLFESHPFLNEVIVWDKKNNKFKNLISLVFKIRKKKYDHVINLHRFFSSGLITAFSGAGNKTGFDKNPLSFFFTTKVKHDIGNGKHEVERNIELIQGITDTKIVKPKLYPSHGDFNSVKRFKEKPYICIAPNSVWFTKQWPAQKWIELIDKLQNYTIYLLGSPSDKTSCDQIAKSSQHKNITNLAGELSFLESAALMKDAAMNYVNDSAPMHIASAMNAPVTAIFCSTIPAFGFGPLSDKSRIVETSVKLDCRPCGIHGHKACPKGHFKCAEIDVSGLVFGVSG